MIAGNLDEDRTCLGNCNAIFFTPPEFHLRKSLAPLPWNRLSHSIPVKIYTEDPIHLALFLGLALAFCLAAAFALPSGVMAGFGLFDCDPGPSCCSADSRFFDAFTASVIIDLGNTTMGIE